MDNVIRIVNFKNHNMRSKMKNREMNFMWRQCSSCMKSYPTNEFEQKINGVCIYCLKEIEKKALDLRSKNETAVLAINEEPVKKRKPRKDKKEKIKRERIKKEPKDPVLKKYDNLRYNAKYQNLPFTLELDDVVNLMSEKYCTCCNTELNTADHLSKMQIDRVDNTKGYIKRNIFPLCKHCGSRKGDNTLESMITLLEYITQNSPRGKDEIS